MLLRVQPGIQIPSVNNQGRN